METSLHRMLKSHYASEASQVEVRIDAYRIDAIDNNGALVEVQHAGLGSIRDKVSNLLKNHTVRVIKPIIANKWIQTMDPKSLEILRRRRSPKRSCHLDIFTSLLHFTSVFPHPRLTLEIPLVDVEEIRVPEKKRRTRAKQFRVLDQKLIGISGELVLHDAKDLWRLIASQPSFIAVHKFPIDFDTAILAEWIDRPRWFAQQVAYVLNRCGAADDCGKSGNAKRYRVDKKIVIAALKSSRPSRAA